jgi:hypothetical protein
MTDGVPTTDPGGSYASQESEAKDRAAEVVLAYRAVDWDGVEQGVDEAVDVLLTACEKHESARHFLEDEVGDLGSKLNDGLERFYADSVGPHLRRPAVLKQLQANRNARKAGPSTNMDEGLNPRARPQVTVGHTVRMNTGCGHLYVTVNESQDGRPFELFNHMGKAGGCAASQNEAIGRLISYALRCGASLEPLIKQLKGISCHRPAWGEDGKIASCSDAIGKALEKYNEAREARGLSEVGAVAPEGAADGNGTRASLVEERASFDALEAGGAQAVRQSRSSEMGRVQGACHDCGGQLSFEEGCVKCHSCGFTECG